MCSMLRPTKQSPVVIAYKEDKDGSSPEVVHLESSELEEHHTNPLTLPVLQQPYSDMFSFSKYRPVSHFIAPHSWMNDPCGIVYVPETKDFILCYQWNPGSAGGGNGAWGVARSKDLITWRDCMPAIRNGTDTEYDSKGVFSGSIVSTMVDGKRVLYLFYTSVSRLPIHWSKPYLKGCESQSVAVSTDFGQSWHRHAQNPLLEGPASKSATTGWRDPHVAEWPNLSTLRGVSPKTNYMMLASGEKERGPLLPIYESTDYIEWKPVGVILRGTADEPISSGSDICFGRNFECASFCTLGGTNYIIAGMEQHPSQTTRHSNRYTLWMSGTLSLEDGKPCFTITAHGLLDYGIFYAPHVFYGAHSEVLMSGWAEEDENKSVESQGWQGLLVHPRELFEVRVQSQVSVDDHIWHHDPATKTMTTLGVRPATEVKGYRLHSKKHGLRGLSSIRSKNYEIEATFTKLSGNETLTFNVRQAPHDREVTRITISVLEGTITINRSSTSLNNGNPLPDSGDFKLLQSELPGASLEDLHVRIFVDNSIIEVYANDRFALSSRIYPSLPTALGVSTDFRDTNGLLDEENVKLECWEGLLNAWPGREQPRLEGKEKLAHIETVELHLQTVFA